MLVFNDGLVRNVRCVYGCLYVIRYIGAKGRRGYGVVALLIQVSEYVLIATQNPLFKGFNHVIKRVEVLGHFKHISIED